MRGKWKKAAAVLAVLLVIIFGCMFAADNIQRGGGSIAVTEGWIVTDVGNLMYKLYTPETATAENKAPGVLLLHGYQNDHETCAAYAIELARRGAVVLALDEYGHGASTAGLVERGYVNHKVTVNYGEDSEADGTFAAISGPVRYKVMMNFSNLSFFDEHYTTDDEGNTLTDSSCGGRTELLRPTAVVGWCRYAQHPGGAYCPDYERASVPGKAVLALPEERRGPVLETA